MAGNSRRRGAMRKDGTKKGAVVGSGGQRRRSLEGKGPTPKAAERTGHPAKRRADAAARAATAASKAAAARRNEDSPETVVGRNPVYECLRAGVPATALYVAVGVEQDERVADSISLAGDAGISIIELPRGDLDRMTGGVLHQGIGLSVPPYRYAHPDDLISTAMSTGRQGLLVALDGVTDPRNLGAVVRSAAAFGAHGVLVPQRRSASMTAVAWRTSAGTAARIPVARATNLTRTLRDAASKGFTVVGLDTEGAVSIDDLAAATEPVLVVVGAEGKGLSRLVRETCDIVVSIPMASAVESLNASVAAGVVLAEIARRRRIGT